MDKSVSFDRAAEYYDQTRGFPPGQEGKAAQAIMEAGALGAHSRVLEIGVGTGRVAEPLTPHIGEMIGLDLSRLMMQRFMARTPGHGVHLLQGDMTRLPLPTASLDAVVAVHVFHLVPGWRQALREVGRVLKPGAHLLLGRSSMGFDDLREAWNKASGFSDGADIGLPRRRWDEGLAENGVTPAGPPVRVEYSYRRAPRVIFGWFEARMFSGQWEMEEEDHQRGLQALEETILKKYGSLDEEVEMPAYFEVRPHTVST